MMPRNSRPAAQAAASASKGAVGAAAAAAAAKSKSKSLILNKRDLKKFSAFANSNPDVEYLYLRDNEFDVFDPYISLDRLKVLDLSINNLSGAVSFLQLTPSLRHLYLTGNRISTLEGLSNLPNLETLCLSENEITSFEGLQNLDNLRVLSLNYNSIQNFRMFPFLPSLYALNLHGNPIAEEAHYRKMAIAVAGTIDQLDKVKVTEDEREQVAYFVGKIVFCIAEGMVVHSPNVEEEAEAFLLEMQREAWKNKPLQLQAIHLRSSKAGSNELVEGVPVSLAVCLQDTRPTFEVETALFHSRFLVPVRFRLLGDASEVLVVGEMNAWRDPVPMQRGVASNGEVSFQTTMYLPSGDYEYRYMVDGQERVMPDSRVVSKFEQGPCNIYHVDEGDIPAGPDETQTILHIRWLRSNAANGFDVIEGENGLAYTPSRDDVGFCLRAEVLAYERGEFSFLYFDISTPIVAGPPSCEKLEIQGKAAEGEMLVADIEYSGGAEGQSVVQWFRVDADGSNEVALESGEIVEQYVCQLADVGKRIRLDYTPVRSDHESGAKVSVTSDVVSSGVPTCKNLDIRGPAVEGEQLVAFVEYSGGVEGDSTFQWFRHNRAENTYEAIQGERSNTYTPGLEDVFHNLAVEYRPVSKDGVYGEPSRCVLENFILPGPPQVSNLSIAGVMQEGMAVMVDFDYKGGRPAAPVINWFIERERHVDPAAAGGAAAAAARSGSSKDHRVPFGRSNQKTQALTVSEVGGTVVVEVTPVREDGIRGTKMTIRGAGPVKPSEPTLKSLKILVNGAEQQQQQGQQDAPVIAGAWLECVEEYHGGEQGASRIEWQRDIGGGNFEVVSRDRKYNVATADEGRMLQLVFTPVRKDGEAGEPKTRMVEVAVSARPAAPAGALTRAGAATPAATPAAAEEQQPRPAASAPASNEPTPAAASTSPAAAPAEDKNDDNAVAATPANAENAAPAENPAADAPAAPAPAPAADAPATVAAAAAPAPAEQ